MSATDNPAIRPITKQDIEETAFILGRAHFLSHQEKETMKFVLELSISKAPMLKDNARDRNFWVLEGEEGSIAGAYSLMTYDTDYQETDWLAWLCVDPDCRGKGYGKKLLTHAIEQARVRGKKHFKLWTTTKEHEQTAQHLYNSFGINIDKKIDDPDEPGITRIYRSLAI